MTSYNAGAVMLGPDTSNVNGRAIDAAWLRQHGIGWHAFKVSQGAWFRDRLAAANHRVDAAHGILECRYHFLESDVAGPHPASGAAQCDAFIAACRAAGGDCSTHGHAIDVESQAPHLGPRYRVVVDFVRRWRQRMPGHPLGVYSGSWYWVGWLGNPAFVGDWLWTSDYITGRGDPFALLKGVTPGYWHPWGGRKAFDLRQFSSSASVDGISPCDVSVYPHDRSHLVALWLPSQRTASPTITHAPAPVVHQVPAGWHPPAEVVALQHAWHIAADGKWADLTDAHAQAIRRNHHDRAEQEACGTTVDGQWGPKSNAAYHAAVVHTQAALNLGLPAKQRLKLDGWWGKVTDAQFQAARRKWYRHFISG